MAGRRAKKKSGRTRAPRNSHFGLKRFFLIFSLIICIIAVIGVGVLIGMYTSAVAEIKSMNVRNLALNYSSVIYYLDEDGNAVPMEEVFNDGNRIWLNSNEIPTVMKDAIVAIEDERFYDHNGLDMKRTTGAFFGWLKAKATGGTTSYGGSTITQQVIKNITNQKQKTAARKVKEMLLAIALEKELSKDEILTIYLNIIYLSNNCYGVESASNMYYSKPAAELTLNEAAVIAGITQRPEYYNPIRNPKNCKYKRDLVLNKMYELGKISKEDLDRTLNQDLDLHENALAKKAKVFSYFTDNLLNEVIEDLQVECGYSKEMADHLVYSGGLSIYSTVDYDIQETLEKYYENESNFPSTKKKAQSAMIIIDPYTGEIKALVGGMGKKTESRGLNRATQSFRQPGSSLKPISVYAPAIEEDLINPSTTVLDAPIKVGDWKPVNSYSGYKGTMSIKRAVQISANTAAVRVLQELTAGKSYDYLTKKFGLTSISKDDRNSLGALALGGLTKGTTPEEMAAAYATFANGGEYIKPYSYTKVVDHSGNVLLEKSGQGKRVIKDSTAFLTQTLLYEVVNTSSGTGKAAKVSGMPTYGKTGTSNDSYDKWFVGFTPYYVAATWYGFDQPDDVTKYGVSSSISAKIWGAVMNQIHKDLDEKEFEIPDSVVKKGSNYFAKDSTLKMSYSHIGEHGSVEEDEDDEVKDSDKETEGDGEKTEDSEKTDESSSSDKKEDEKPAEKEETPPPSSGNDDDGITSLD